MLKVIGAGFGRTGTASMKAALEHLGLGPCYHMFEVIAKPERIELWGRAADGEPVDWDDVLDGFQSTVDWPGCSFWRQLVDAHPDAKVVLTVRDPQRWYDSTYNTIYQFVKDTGSGADLDDFSRTMRPNIDKLIWNGTFDGRFEDRDHAIEVFEAHNEQVRQGVPADRLLEFEVSQGWEPLCEFLGVDVPSEEFPHVNDAGSIQALVEQVRREGRVPSPFAV